MIHTQFLQGLYLRVETPSNGLPSKVLVIAQSFAEEMNKSRRQMTLLAQTLAKSGIATVLFDVSGTGDSHEELVDVTWAKWQADLRCVHDFVHTQWPGAKHCVLGHRLGCMLIASTALAWHQTVFWQPIYRGDAVATQLLRLAMNSPHHEGQSTKQLRELLRQHGQLEIAGYAITNSLLESIESLTLSTFQMPKVHVFELSPPDAAIEPSPGLTRYLATQTNANATSHTLPGVSFWMTQEITTSLALNEATKQALCHDHA